MKKIKFNHFTIVQDVYSLVRDYRRHFVALIVVGSVVYLLGIIQTLLMGSVIDKVIQNSYIIELSRLLLIVGIISLLSINTDLLESYLISIISNKIDLTIKNRFFEQFLNNKLYLKKNRGDVFEKIDRDTGVYSHFIINICYGTIMDSFSILVLLIVIFNISYKMSLLLLLQFPILLVINNYFGAILKDINYKYKNLKDQYFSFLNEIISGWETIRNFEANPFFVEKHSRETKLLYKVKINAAEKYISNNFLSDVVKMIFQLMILVVGIIEIKSGTLSIGFFSLYFTLSSQLVGGIYSITKIGVKFQEALVSIERVNELEFNQNFIEKKEIHEQIKGLELENLSFSYGEKMILDNVNYEFTSGKLYTIVGKSGIGKSTLLELINDNIKAIGGKVFIKSGNVKNLATSINLKNRICLVRQEDFIFNETIRTNIFLDKVIEPDIINKYLEMLQIEDIGLDYQIGESSSSDTKKGKISIGQKQRISLARALVRQPDVLLLDEVSSALDSESEEVIYKVIKEYSKNHIVIFVTHREHAMSSADIVLRLSEGTLKEQKIKK